MVAKYIIAALGVLFLSLSGGKILLERGRIGPAARSWLMVGVIFSAVACWLWIDG